MQTGRSLDLERLTLTMLLRIAELNEAPIVAALVRRIEHDRRVVDELAAELDRLDPIDPRD